MKQLHLLFLGLILSICVYAQSGNKVKIIPTHISSKIKLLIPEGDHYIYESYFYLKGGYGLVNSDTLLFKKGNTLKGRKLTLDLNQTYFEYEPCDTFINYLRNSSLYERTISAFEDTARSLIGYDNEDFNTQKYINDKNKPLFEDEKLKCFPEYKRLNEVWFNYQLHYIHHIKELKEQRYLEIIKSDTVSKGYITNFLNDFDNCDIDKKAIIELIIKNTNDFIKICQELSGNDFFEMNLRLCDLPNDSALRKAIFSLKNSTLISHTKKKLIKTLKKKPIYSDSLSSF